MVNLFDIIPSGFFNNLASGSSNRIYSDCLQIIYNQYDREISYRIARNQLRDALAVYLLENHVTEEELGEELTDRKNYSDMASAVLRRFCSKEIGWLEEDSDDATYEKHIIMTEQGIRLAEFLEQLRQPEREEFSSYIFNIYSILRSGEQWSQDPYAEGLKNIYRNAKMLAKALKRLSTFIKKIIERMVREETLESLTENIIEYCEGNFVREYARLTKQQNIHIYRTFIKGKLMDIQSDGRLSERLVKGCAEEEGLSKKEAEDQVFEMLQTTRRFLTEDYDQIMQEIRHKINVYLQIAVGRARFLRNRELNIRGSIERTIRYLAEEMDEIGWKEELPAEAAGLFLLEPHEFIDTDSVRFPRRQQVVQNETSAQIEKMTVEDIAKAKASQEREAFNPYSKEKMKEYLENALGTGRKLESDALPMESRRDLLCALSAVAYGQENGYEVRALDGYLETQNLLLRRFEIIKKI